MHSAQRVLLAHFLIMFGHLKSSYVLWDLYLCSIWKMRIRRYNRIIFHNCKQFQYFLLEVYYLHSQRLRSCLYIFHYLCHTYTIETRQVAKRKSINDTEMISNCWYRCYFCSLCFSLHLGHSCLQMWIDDQYNRYIQSVRIQCNLHLMIWFRKIRISLYDSLSSQIIKKYFQNNIILSIWPGQVWSWHSDVMLDSPKHVPRFFSSINFDLVSMRIPKPHVTEHWPGFQSVHTQSTQRSKWRSECKSYITLLQKFSTNKC